MARRASELDLVSIIKAVGRHPGGASASQIADELNADTPRRTLQHRLKTLVDEGRLVRDGEARWAKYRLPTIGSVGNVGAGAATISASVEAGPPSSAGGREVRDYVRQPLSARRPVGYDREFLDSYRPNVSSYLSDEQKEHLSSVGARNPTDAPAGTFARQILNRLLIELAWNSSRLEGNTYSLLDTRRLIEFGRAAEGRQRLEAQMILNHKDAIEFLVDSAGEIGFNRYTILNLHAMLANNLLEDPSAAGRLRHIAVAIETSTFHPLEVPQLIEEAFEQLLATAAAIDDPFEQSLFVLVQLPYLQPFDHVNKRVSRLAANIPLIRANLSPLSFPDIGRSTYTDAVLGVYEMRRVDLIRDVFLWAYERSAAKYAAVRQSLGEPDPFRLKYRDTLREVVREVVHRQLDKRAAFAHIESWTATRIGQADRDQFREMAESELLALHEGNFARYRITPDEFAAWHRGWR